MSQLGRINGIFNKKIYIADKADLNVSFMETVSIRR